MKPFELVSWVSWQMIAGRRSVTVRLLWESFGSRTSWSGSRSVAATEKVTNDNSSSTVWQQASAIGSQKLWELVIPLSAAFTEAIYNEANTFQVRTMTGGRSVWGAKAGRARVQSSSQGAASLTAGGWAVCHCQANSDRPGRDFY